MSTAGREATGDFDEYLYVPVRHPLFLEADRLLLAKFCTFHENHPDIFGLFVHYALELRASGRQRGSGWAIAQRIRWDYWLETSDDEPFSINNDYIALYSRLTIYYFPQFANFFTLRRMKSFRYTAC